MEFLNIYLDIYLIDIIYNNLNLKDKLSFSKVNKFIFINYHNKLKKEIYKYTNTNYSNFIILLNNIHYFDYEKLSIAQHTINTINKVYSSPTLLVYDLRFIFELIYRNINIYKLKSDENLFRYLLKIKQCMYLNRDFTIWNINDEPMLQTLHWWFIPFNLRNIENKNWTSIYTRI